MLVLNYYLCDVILARETSSLVNGFWGNRSPGVVTKAREIARVPRGISGVVLGDSRLDGGKRGLVCALMSMEADLSQFWNIFIKCVHLSLVT